MFSYPLIFDTPVRVHGARGNFAISFGMDILEWWGYRMANKLRICVTVYTQYQRVTDRHLAMA